MPKHNPEWWDWELVFSGHAERRMEERGVSEVEVRTMLKRRTSVEAKAAEGRFTVRASHKSSSWVVIVEPDLDATMLVVVTVYEDQP